MILDSNIIIYSALPENQYLRDLVETESPCFSSISRAEVLGFRTLSENDSEYFQEFFTSLEELGVSEIVIVGAIDIRQRRKIGLGDSLIAATAIAHELPLVTNNLKDFSGIENLDIIDPRSL